MKRDRARRAGLCAGAAAGAAFGVELRLRAAAGQQAKPDRLRVAMVFADTALHGVLRQAGVIGGRAPRKGTARHQRAGLAGVGAGAAERAGALANVQNC